MLEDVILITKNHDSPLRRVAIRSGGQFKMAFFPFNKNDVSRVLWVGLQHFFLYMKVNITGYNFDSYNFLPISHFEGANKTYPHSEVITPTYDR